VDSSTTVQNCAGGTSSLGRRAHPAEEAGDPWPSRDLPIDDYRFEGSVQG
jgi:hypothetical protein